VIGLIADRRTGAFNSFQYFIPVSFFRFLNLFLLKASIPSNLLVQLAIVLSGALLWNNGCSPLSDRFSLLCFLSFFPTFRLDSPRGYPFFFPPDNGNHTPRTRSAPFFSVLDLRRFYLLDPPRDYRKHPLGSQEAFFPLGSSSTTFLPNFANHDDFQPMLGQFALDTSLRRTSRCPCVSLFSRSLRLSPSG